MKYYIHLFLIIFTLAISSTNTVNASLEKAILESNLEHVKKEIGTIQQLTREEKIALADLAQNVIMTRRDNRNWWIIPEAIISCIGYTSLSTGLLFAVVHLIKKQPAISKITNSALCILLYCGIGATIIKVTNNHYARRLSLFENAMVIKSLIQKIKTTGTEDALEDLKNIDKVIAT